MKAFILTLILTLALTGNCFAVEVSYQKAGGYYGDIYKMDKSVLVSAPEDETIEVVATEPDTDKEVITKASLCFEDGTGCMELEQK